jgi:hypothetical protein
MVRLTDMDIFYLSSILNILWYLFSALFVLYKFTSFFSYMYNFVKFCGRLISGIFYVKNQTLSYFNNSYSSRRRHLYTNLDVETGNVEPDIGILNTNTYTRPSLFTRVKETFQNLYDSSVAYGQPIYETVFDRGQGIYNNSSFDTDAVELQKFVGQKSEVVDKGDKVDTVVSEIQSEITDEIIDMDKQNFYKSLKKIDSHSHKHSRSRHELESISEMESVNFDTNLNTHLQREPIKFNKKGGFSFKSRGNWLNKEGLSDSDINSIIDEDSPLFEN